MNLISLCRTGYRRCKRIAAWIPILWKDEDWDPAYLFEIMRFKISRMRKNMEENARHLGYEKNVRDMVVAEKLLARMGLSDFYWDLSQALEGAEKAGRCSCPPEIWGFEPDCYDKEGKSRSTRMINLSCSFCKENRKRWFKRSDAKENADRAFLFRHLEKKSRQWWD